MPATNPILIDFWARKDQLRRITISDFVLPEPQTCIYIDNADARKFEVLTEFSEHVFGFADSDSFVFAAAETSPYVVMFRREDLQENDASPFLSSAPSFFLIYNGAVLLDSTEPADTVVDVRSLEVRVVGSPLQTPVQPQPYIDSDFRELGTSEEPLPLALDADVQEVIGNAEVAIDIDDEAVSQEQQATHLRVMPSFNKLEAYWSRVPGGVAILVDGAKTGKTSIAEALVRLLQIRHTVVLFDHGHNLQQLRFMADVAFTGYTHRRVCVVIDDVCNLTEFEQFVRDFNPRGAIIFATSAVAQFQLPQSGDWKMFLAEEFLLNPIELLLCPIPNEQSRRLLRSNAAVLQDVVRFCTSTTGGSHAGLLTWFSEKLAQELTADTEPSRFVAGWVNKALRFITTSRQYAFHSFGSGPYAVRLSSSASAPTMADIICNAPLFHDLAILLRYCDAFPLDYFQKLLKRAHPEAYLQFLENAFVLVNEEDRIVSLHPILQQVILFEVARGTLAVTHDHRTELAVFTMNYLLSVPRLTKDPQFLLQHALFFMRSFEGMAAVEASWGPVLELTDAEKRTFRQLAYRGLVDMLMDCGATQLAMAALCDVGVLMQRAQTGIVVERVISPFTNTSQSPSSTATGFWNDQASLIGNIDRLLQLILNTQIVDGVEVEAPALTAEQVSMVAALQSFRMALQANPEIFACTEQHAEAVSCSPIPNWIATTLTGESTYEQKMRSQASQLLQHLPAMSADDSAATVPVVAVMEAVACPTIGDADVTGSILPLSECRQSFLRQRLVMAERFRMPPVPVAPPPAQQQSLCIVQ
eukprot:TRINITY_DN2414_c0_g1_i1.p1 TRINITY_DN2414_c0_g1~~TRINITY_DN2414_c0_g1_i1.p1  ORF type:complete len:813 (-),score=187.17 TRINITY_DN2414_c0_g1_i1:276-2714(-)